MEGGLFAGFVVIMKYSMASFQKPDLSKLKKATGLSDYFPGTKVWRNGFLACSFAQSNLLRQSYLTYMNKSAKRTTPYY